MTVYYCTAKRIESRHNLKDLFTFFTFERVEIYWLENAGKISYCSVFRRRKLTFENKTAQQEVLRKFLWVKMKVDIGEWLGGHIDIGSPRKKYCRFQGKKHLYPPIRKHPATLLSVFLYALSRYCLKNLNHLGQEIWPFISMILYGDTRLLGNFSLLNFESLMIK